MRSYLSALSLALMVSTTSYAQGLSYETRAVDASEILDAARDIQVQTGPAYLVNGALSCSEFAKEFPPYGADTYCQLTVNNETRAIEKPEKLLSALKQIKPMTGPAYSFDANFSASSISQEVPPYQVIDKAEIIVAAYIPTKEILAASRKIQAQTGPAYLVRGRLNCTQIVREVPPYESEQNCQVTLENYSAQVQDPSEILTALQQIKAPSGPYYSFEADFTASSITAMFPPYQALETVKLALFK
ncbi:hypothetical protein [Thalassomonas actiniarum]|uniref:DUF4377 domain-containing protein n=1 Tax=Thalassomonas actiniarum TaxID=485447 RepID=A0AAE9YTY4_9GAMM|nr:hypothetical protein [Thalassomonas actiniarum]WDE01041.1 hypothetical protein SG35_010625 [Thalassomonas actiniarum]